MPSAKKVVARCTFARAASPRSDIDVDAPPEEEEQKKSASSAVRHVRRDSRKECHCGRVSGAQRDRERWRRVVDEEEGEEEKASSRRSRLRTGVAGDADDVDAVADDCSLEFTLRTSSIAPSACWRLRGTGT